MFSQRISRLPAVLVAWVALAATAFCAGSLTVTDLKGRSIAIELISQADIGQNTSTPALFSVLSSQSFETTMKPVETFTKETEAFFTSYDSDNKGSGNVGGYQYFGYILALANKPDLIKQVVKMPKGTLLSDKLGAAPNPAKRKVPQ